MSQDNLLHKVLHCTEKPEFYYMRISLEFDPNERTPTLDIMLFKNLIAKALKGLFGNLGAAMQVDVLRFDSKTREAILRVENGGLVQLWSSLTSTSSYRDYTCCFHIHKVSSCLLSLSTNSRTFQHKVLQAGVK